MDPLTQAAAWASIGQLILAIIALVWQLRQKPSPPATQLNLRLVAAVVGGGLILVLPGLAVYWAAILYATSSPGTATTLVIRSTVSATLLSMTWGVVWSLAFLPRIIKRIRRQP